MSVTLGINFNKEAVASRYKILLQSSSDETKAVFNEQAPSVPFQWLACRYSRHMKRNYFTDSRDIVCIISEELGYNTTSERGSTCIPQYYPQNST
jgi:hypothetical protein